MQILNLVIFSEKRSWQQQSKTMKSRMRSGDFWLRHRITPDDKDWIIYCSSGTKITWDNAPVCIWVIAWQIVSVTLG
jgi:hypothetical protein